MHSARETIPSPSEEAEKESFPPEYRDVCTVDFPAPPNHATGTVSRTHTPSFRMLSITLPADRAKEMSKEPHWSLQADRNF